MKKWVAIVLAVAVVPVLAGVAGAQMGWGPGYGMPWGNGSGWMAWGPGGGPGGGAPCPGAAAAGDTTTAVTEEKAKEIAEQYAAKYLKGYTVEKVLPFTGMRGGTAYSVELKGPKDEMRTLHVNPWGGVMPFGGPGRRAG